MAAPVNSGLAETRKPASDKPLPRYHRPFPQLGFLLLPLLLLASCLDGFLARAEQTSPADTAGTVPFALSISVDEVSVAFRAADSAGMPISNLTLQDLQLLDNGKPPKKVFSFVSNTNLPIRGGILIDTSRSMLEYLYLNQMIAVEYVAHLLHQDTDRAFVMRFDSEAKILQDWTNDPNALTASIRGVARDANSRMGGTVLFDSIYRACRDSFKADNSFAASSFIMLFSDGLDNASHALIEDDVRMCQRANTVVYAFDDEDKSRFSEGQKTLKDLAAKTGGRIFYPFTRSDESIRQDLRIMESQLRGEYRIVYKPQSIKPNGAFHSVQLSTPRQGVYLTGQTGYYAPEAKRR